MNTNQLKYFIAAADKKSLHKASDELFITHQCLSSAIRKLEEEIGVPLFNRTAQGVFLNSNGLEVYRMAKAILQEVATTQEKLCNLADKETATLNIMTSFGMSHLVFNNVLKKFKEENKTVQLRIFNKGSLEAMEALNAGKADLAFVGLPKGYSGNQQFANILYADTFEETMNILVHSGHPLAKFQRISAKQALQYPIMLYQANVEEPENFMVNRIYTINHNAQIEMISDNIDLYNEMIASGMAIGFVGQSVVKSKVLAEDMAKLSLSSIKMTGGFSLRIVCLINQESLKSKHKWIQSFCQSFAANMYLKQIEHFW